MAPLRVWLAHPSETQALCLLLVRKDQVMDLKSLWKKHGTLYSTEDESAMTADIRTAIHCAYGAAHHVGRPVVDLDWSEANVDLDGIMRS